MRTTSLSPTSTVTSIRLKSAMRKSSVPLIWLVPTTLSPFSTSIWEMMPSMGAYKLVLSRFSRASLSWASPLRTAYSAAFRLLWAISSSVFACWSSAVETAPCSKSSWVRSQLVRAWCASARWRVYWARSVPSDALARSTCDRYRSGRMRRIRSPALTRSPSLA